VVSLKVGQSIVHVTAGLCRECAVKFNDYFEFPREVDMSPYTAATLAKLEGKLLTVVFVF